MAIQASLFNTKNDQIINKKYNHKINGLIYEITGEKPLIQELIDDRKTHVLIIKIKRSNISIEEKNFLINAAMRHTVFNYEKIAEYYAHATKEMQELMEDSALVIIDFKKAIELGYAELKEQVAQQYIEDCENG